MQLIEIQRRFRDKTIDFQLEMYYSSGRTKIRNIYLLGLEDEDLTWHQPTERFINNVAGVFANKDLDRFERWIEETCEQYHEEVHVSEWMKRLLKIIALKEEIYRIQHPRLARVTGILRGPESSEEKEEDCLYEFPPSPPREPMSGLNDLPF